MKKGKMRNDGKSGKLKKPWFKKPSLETSIRMRLIRSFGTQLERNMERVLSEERMPYERQPNLTGRPDFRIKGTNVVIFCDSSFWHGRRKKELDGVAFKKNRTFWKTKLLTNRNRDARINRALRQEGWSVLRFWDTDVIKNPDTVRKKLLDKIKENAKSKTDGN